MKVRSRSPSDKGGLVARRRPYRCRRLAWLVSFCAIGLFGRGSWAAADPHPCHLKEYASLPLVVLMGGPPLVSVQINGRATRMELDLGSAQSLLYDGAVPRLGLKSRPLPYGARKIEVAGKELTQYATVPSFKLNQLELRNVDILVQPADSIPSDVATGDAIVGRLSPASLANVDVELDLAHGKLNLFAPSSCEGTYWSKQYAVVPMRQSPLGDWFFDMELDGKKVESKFTTGAIQSYIFTNVTKKVYGWDDRSPGVEVVEAPAGGRLTHYRAMSLTTHGMSVMNAQIYLQNPTDCMKDAGIVRDQDGAESFAGCLGIAPLQVGIAVLKQLRLYMAVKQHKLYFTEAEAD